jgi:hypothetical protein
MPGAGDYFEQNVLNYLAGSTAMPTSPANPPPIFMALFTTAPTSDAGTGGTEVSTSATNYARQQIAGQLTTSAATASGSTLTFSSVPAWVTVGMSVIDLTTSGVIPANTRVATISSPTLTLNNAVTGGGVLNGDHISFSAFAPASASSGTEPATTPGAITNTNTIVTFNQSTGSWGTVTSFALYDAVTSGNFLAWDYIGSFKWIPFTCTSASPGVLTADTTADAPANGSSIVVTQKYGATLPTTAGSWAGLLTTAGLSGATFNAGVNTTSIGGGLFRQVTQQIIGNNTTPSFATSQFTISMA